MRQRVLSVLILVALAASPTLAAPSETGSAFDRRIERLVATPTPAGPLLLASDQASWRVDVPASAIVTVEAEGSGTAPFLFRAHRVGAAQASFVVPTTHAGFVLSEAGAWRVSVDPLGGVAVDIVVRFRGHVADPSGGPAPFTLTELAIDRGCLLPDVCLP